MCGVWISAYATNPLILPLPTRLIGTSRPGVEHGTRAILLDHARRLFGLILPLKVVHADPLDTTLRQLNRDASADPRELPVISALGMVVSWTVIRSPPAAYSRLKSLCLPVRHCN